MRILISPCTLQSHGPFAILGITCVTDRSLGQLRWVQATNQRPNPRSNQQYSASSSQLIHRLVPAFEVRTLTAKESPGLTQLQLTTRCVEQASNAPCASLMASHEIDDVSDAPHLHPSTTLLHDHDAAASANTQLIQDIPQLSLHAAVHAIRQQRSPTSI
jgi:hypothetical protein